VAAEGLQHISCTTGASDGPSCGHPLVKRHFLVIKEHWKLESVRRANTKYSKLRSDGFSWRDCVL